MAAIHNELWRPAFVLLLLLLLLLPRLALLQLLLPVVVAAAAVSAAPAAPAVPAAAAAAAAAAASAAAAAANGDAIASKMTLGGPRNSNGVATPWRKISLDCLTNHVLRYGMNDSRPGGARVGGRIGPCP